MKRPAFYNEIDIKTAAWLDRLIGAGELTPGVVDRRSIFAVQPEDVGDFQFVHLFAGIGGWDYALRLADWPADQSVWTGSCPCQPFSIAGRGKGTNDERHLWPDFLRLIRECRPPVIFGEQVASPLGHRWLAGVRADLEALGYAVGAADLCAAGVGAPHIRQRLYWVALSGQQQEGRCVSRCGEGSPQSGSGAASSESRRSGSGADGMAHSDQLGCQWAHVPERQRGSGEAAPEQQGSDSERLGHTISAGLQERPESKGRSPTGNTWAPTLATSTLEPWADYTSLHLSDGTARRIGAGIQPLAHGIPARVGRLRGYGNAIVPQVAAVFIRAVMMVKEGA